MQKTLNREIRVRGTGIHSGRQCIATVSPAPSGSGIMLGTSGCVPVPIATLHRAGTPRCTSLTMSDGSTLQTVEHLLAALAVAEVDNVIIVVEGGEVPILDGSAEEWHRELLAAGIAHQEAPDLRFSVTKPFSFVYGPSLYEAAPGAIRIGVEIDYPGTAIGRQSCLVEGAGLRALIPARTFALQSEVEALRMSGLAGGGSLDNAVVIGPSGPINPEGFRHPMECAMHKALDLVGDLMLSGRRIEGRFRAYRPGHAGNAAFLDAMHAAGIILPLRDLELARAA